MEHVWVRVEDGDRKAQQKDAANYGANANYTKLGGEEGAQDRCSDLDEDEAGGACAWHARLRAARTGRG